MFRPTVNDIFMGNQYSARGCAYIYMNDSIYNDTRGIVLKRSKGVGLTVENVSPAGYLCLPRSLSLSLSVCWVNMPLLDVCTCHNFAESPAVLI